MWKMPLTFHIAYIWKCTNANDALMHYFEFHHQNYNTKEKNAQPITLALSEKVKDTGKMAAKCKLISTRTVYSRFS